MAINDGLLSLWEFEDDLTDSQGSNDLTAVGSSAAYASAVGNLGKGLEFDGSLRVQKASPSSLSPTSTITIGIACNIPAMTTRGELIDRIGGTEGFGLHVQTTTSTFRTVINGGAGNGQSSAAIDTGSLVFLMMTYNKDAGGTDEGKLYINNAADGTMNYSTAIDYTPDPNLAIGAFYGGGNELVNGSIIYQLAIWNRVITSVERSIWYGSGSGYNFSSPPVSTGNFFALF